MRYYHSPYVTLEQWRVLHAVVDVGGYAQAAELLNKSQSAVTYAVQKLERTLGVKAFQLEGRKATLTDTGKLLYRRAGQLLEQAVSLETVATRLAQGEESQIRLAVDTVFPTWMLLNCLSAFANTYPYIRIELLETVLGGTEQAMTERAADFAIGPQIPPGFLGTPLMRLRFIAVAAPTHPLHQLNRPITYHDLRHHRQLVIRDSGSKRKQSAGWLGAEQRWTVSNKATSIHAACMGLGFAWYPESMITAELKQGSLKPLLLEQGAERFAELYLIFSDQDYIGPGAQALINLLRQAIKSENG